MTNLLKIHKLHRVIQPLVIAKRNKKSVIGAMFGWEVKEKDDESAIAEVGSMQTINMAKQRLNLLASKTKVTNKRGYKPPEDVEARIQRVVEQTCSTEGEDWRNVDLTDRRIKFKILTELISELRKDVPAISLTDINTVQDAVNFFSTEIHETSALEDLALSKLPKNLHIDTEYVRFDPDNDTLFDGRTAFPGRDTHVTSIKYGRKYRGIKTTYDKPGYFNHYENY